MRVKTESVLSSQIGLLSSISRKESKIEKI